MHKESQVMSSPEFQDVEVNGRMMPFMECYQRYFGNEVNPRRSSNPCKLDKFRVLRILNFWNAEKESLSSEFAYRVDSKGIKYKNYDEILNAFMGLVSNEFMKKNRGTEASASVYLFGHGIRAIIMERYPPELEPNLFWWIKYRKFKPVKTKEDVADKADNGIKTTANLAVDDTDITTNNIGVENITSEHEATPTTP